MHNQDLKMQFTCISQLICHTSTFEHCHKSLIWCRIGNCCLRRRLHKRWVVYTDFHTICIRLNIDFSQWYLDNWWLWWVSWCRGYLSQARCWHRCSTVLAVGRLRDRSRWHSSLFHWHCTRMSGSSGRNRRFALFSCLRQSSSWFWKSLLNSECPNFLICQGGSCIFCRRKYNRAISTSTHQ